MIPKEDLLSLPIPPLPEQERIVSELDCINGILEKKREQLKELDALAQSIFYHMFGDPVTNEKGWEVKKLGEVVKSNMIGLTRSATEQDDTFEYLYFKMNNISNTGHTDYSKTIRVDATPSDVEKYSLKVGDFLFNTRNSFDLVGKSCVYYRAEESVVLFNNNIMRIEFSDNVHTTYMLYLFQDSFIKSQLDKIKKGTTSVWAIYYKDLEHIKVLLPPLPLQQSFATKIEAIEKQKELIKRSIAEVETLLASRMQHYFG
jgi:type I restriction enzyme S subunit